MAYSTQSDLENYFGTANVRIWSNLSSSATTTDTARVAAAIAYADDVIDSRFRQSRYVVPLLGNNGSLPACVTSWSARIAGVWLYNSRGFADGATEQDDERNRTRRHEKDSLQEMDACLSGARVLDCIEERWQGDGPIMVS